MRPLLVVGLALLALGEAVAALRNLAENDVLVALFYFVATVGFVLAAARGAGRGLAVGLGLAAAAQIGRMLAYGAADVAPLVLGLLLFGAAALALAAAGAFALSRGSPAWARPALAGGLAMEAARALFVVVVFSPSFPGVLTPLLGVVGATLAAAGAWRAR